MRKPIIAAINGPAVGVGAPSETDLARADDLDARAFWWSGTQPDAREGVRAFLEKRPPRWSMRPSRDLPDFLPPPSRGR